MSYLATSAQYVNPYCHRAISMVSIASGSVLDFVHIVSNCERSNDNRRR